MSGIGRGGIRVNAGRKSGSLTRKSVELAEKALAQGVAPISVITAEMNFNHELAELNRPTIKVLNAKQAASDSFDPEIAKKIRELSVPG